MTSETGKEIIARHLSPNISGSNRVSHYKNMVTVIKLGYFVS